MKNRINKSGIFVIILLLISCQYQHIDKLEQALRYARNNRAELEKVLLHFQNDSLKLKAAEFLITHMPGHYSYADTSYYKEMHQEMDSLTEIFKNLNHHERDQLYEDFLKKHQQPPLTVREDISFISADYLINNIENAFKVWEGIAWNRHVDFDLFCEYILPYKVVEGQELDNWREYFYEPYNGDLEKHQYCQLYKYSPHAAALTVSYSLGYFMQPRIVFHAYENPINRVDLLAQIPSADCYYYSIVTTAVMRAKGIPCFMDFLPQWPYQSNRHSWCAILKNSGKHSVIETPGSLPGSLHKEDERMGKIFRRTYSRNSEIEQMNRTEKHVPSLFRNLFMKDVTDHYMETVNIDLRLETTPGNKYAYLAVFNNQEWIPIHWGKVKKKTITFEKMEKDIVYLPVMQNESGLFSIADPILLTIQGEQISLKPDTLKKQTLKLKRKFPPFHKIYDIGHRIVGGRFQASNDSLFENPVTLHTIEKFGMNSEEVDLSSLQENYRYWRFLSADHGHTNIAELFFYSSETGKPIRGEIIGTPGSYNNEPQYRKEAAFDGDALTFSDIPDVKDSWVGMDFGEPVSISKIVYYPRSDGNLIELGDEYELLYWGKNRWQSMGKQTAEQVILTYENCPSNALFLLRNHTKGKEERIFTYENEEQIFW